MKHGGKKAGINREILSGAIRGDTRNREMFYANSNGIKTRYVSDQETVNFESKQKAHTRNILDLLEKRGYIVFIWTRIGSASRFL